MKTKFINRSISELSFLFNWFIHGAMPQHGVNYYNFISLDIGHVFHCVFLQECLLCSWLFALHRNFIINSSDSTKIHLGILIKIILDQYINLGENNIFMILGITSLECTALF